MKPVSGGSQKKHLILQIRQIERRQVRRVRPRNQVGALLQPKIRRRHRPRKPGLAIAERDVQLRPRLTLQRPDPAANGRRHQTAAIRG